MAQRPYIQVPLSAIGERYADLRIVQPQAETAMERSMARYGQMTPVAVGGGDGERTHEMVDGFKRLRAARKLGYDSLYARVVAGGAHAVKAAIIHLNTKGRTIADLETGLVIRSLYRQDGLNQVQIAALLGRHKSFVCRRLKLVEQLCDEVLEHLRLGLINITTGRELARLPAGNQREALATVIRYRFTGEQTARLVGLLLEQPRWNTDAIVRLAEPISTEPHPQRLSQDRCRRFYEQLVKTDLFLTSVTRADLDDCRSADVSAVIERIQTALTSLGEHLS
jgi:ParB-like chromosome segregation protein Spo0J